MAQTDQCAPDRQAADKGFGAVDRVEHPAISAASRPVVEFLAGNAVTGIFGDDKIAHGGFSAAIRLRDGVERVDAFIGDTALFSEMRKYDRAGAIGQLMSELQELAIESFLEHWSRRPAMSNGAFF